MDDPPPPYAAVDPMALAAQPNNRPASPVSPSQAAGPMIVLQPGGIIQDRANLADDVQESLRDVLELVKHRILPDSAVSDEEFSKFLDLVFAGGWQPGQFCEAANDQMTRRSANDCAYTFGTLLESLQVSAKRAGKPTPRSSSERELHRQNAPRATQWWRQAGAPVRMLVEHKKQGQVTFSLRDHKLAIIHGDAKVNYDGDGAADAYFHAMRRNDDFMASTVHRYNMLQVVYICRNRLTHWSNPGAIIPEPPRSEKLDKALSAVKLCRNIVSSIDCPCLGPFDDADTSHITG